LLSSVIRLSQLIAHLRPSVVLSWQTKAHIYASPAATLARTSAKVVYFQKNTPDKSWLSRFIRALPATGALACSEYVATRERALTRIPVLAVPSASEFVELSQAGIESLRAEGRALRDTLPLPEGCKIAIMVGRLQSWKGFQAFVQAIATLRQEGLNIAGIIVGGSDFHESNYETILRDFIESLGLNGQIHLAGSQSRVAPWFLAADLFVHASREEPFGQVILEAMALGVPVIACRPGGPEEIVTHGQDGLLYEHGRQDELVNSMRQLALDSEVCLRYRQQAQESARRFAPSLFLTRLHDALASLPGATPDA
jgi:glycosyltransferase involved in cell wall biosynthesis